MKKIIFTFLSLFCMSCFGYILPPPAPKPPVENQQLALDIYKHLVEIPSTHDYGTKEVADLLAAKFAEAGLSKEDIQLIPEINFPRQVNLVVRLKGTGKAKPILWICHIDVVPAKASDWSLPPFKFTQKDGYFYGRGTADMKDEDAAVAAALIRLKKEGFVPDRDIIVAFTTDEEVGKKQNGLNYLVNHHRNLIDAALAINPDGGSGEIEQGKRLNFGIETSEKVYVSFLLKVTNKGGHSSEPRPDNAIYTLASALEKISQYQFPVALNSTTKLYFQRLADLNAGQIKSDMLAVSKESPDLLAAKRLSENPAYNAALHTTCVATMLSAGVQENALPQTATATIQCRVMPNETVEQTKLTLAKVIGNPEVQISLVNPVMSAPESPISSGFISHVEKVAHSMWPGVTILPGMDTATTDSRYTRNINIPSYGIGGGWYDIDDIRWHGKDERTEINDFYSTVEFTYRLMKELSNQNVHV